MLQLNEQTISAESAVSSIKNSKKISKNEIFKTAPMLRKLAKKVGFFATAKHMKNIGFNLEETRNILINKIG